MPRPRAMDNQQVDELLTILRKHGLHTFKFRGFEGSFAPNLPGGVDNGEELDAVVAAERLKNAVSEFNRVNEEDRLNLEWST